MSRTLGIALLAAIGLSIVAGCGSESPPIHTKPASRRFLKKNAEPPPDYRPPGSEDPPSR
jgi:hypothetical protein